MKLNFFSRELQTSVKECKEAIKELQAAVKKLQEENEQKKAELKRYGKVIEKLLTMEQRQE